MQSSLYRTQKDAKQWLLSSFISWILACVVPLGCGVFSALFIPTKASILTQAVYGAVGALAGLILFILVVYLVHLVITPYRQRNEARTEIEKLTQERDRLNQEHTSQINEMQKKLNDPILGEKQKIHIGHVEELILIWAESLSITPISLVFPGTLADIDNLKKNTRFNCLRGHLPFDELWQNYSDWDLKILEYLDKCKKLRSEIEASWEIKGTKKTGSFDYTILKMVEGEKFIFKMSYGFDHNLQELEHQSLTANGIRVVLGNEFSMNGTYKEINDDDECRQQVICKEFLEVANYFSNKPLTMEIKQLALDLKDLQLDMIRSLHEIEERADHVIRHCPSCPQKE